jgi:hypothetical protein
LCRLHEGQPGGFQRGRGVGVYREKETRTSVGNLQNDTPVSVVILPLWWGSGQSPDCGEGERNQLRRLAGLFSAICRPSSLKSVRIPSELDRHLTKNILSQSSERFRPTSPAPPGAPTCWPSKNAGISFLGTARPQGFEGGSAPSQAGQMAIIWRSLPIPLRQSLRRGREAPL